MSERTELEIETVLVPAGRFRMGDARGRGDEQPEHEVYVSAFRVALLPVTNEEYARFVAETGHEPSRFHDDPAFNAPRQPVVGVSWFDAVAYCEWLSKRTGERWRLPTEAEREKAARGGVDGARFPWGDDAGPDGGRFAQDAPNVVGQSQANGYRAVRHGLQRARVVLGLVRGRLLRALAEARPEGAAVRQAARVAGRRVAAPDQDQPLRGAEQPRSVVPVQRLRVPRGAGRVSAELSRR